MSDPASLPPQDPLAAAMRQRSIILRFVRMGFLVLITTVALLLTIQTTESKTATGGQNLPLEWWVPFSFAVVLFVLALLVDLFTPNKKISTIAGVFIGLVAGMLCTAALGVVIDLLLASYVQTPRMHEALQPLISMLKVMLGITLSYLGVTTVLQTQDDFRLVIPYVEFAKQIRGVRPTILDTSALIDARIADVAASGLLQSSLVVPKFVLAELQLLSDSSDKLKRARGRRGLDVVTRLQRQGTIDVTIDDTRVTAMAVDQMLVELALRLSARLMTTDLGLTRVAQIRGVGVLNMHDIASAFKPALIPGELLSLRIVKPGEQPGQGVGYLDDGTMVVAEGAQELIGVQVSLLVTGTMQTTAGRLVFAKVVESDGGEPARIEPSPHHPAPAPAHPDSHAAPHDRADYPAAAHPEAQAGSVRPLAPTTVQPPAAMSEDAAAERGQFPPRFGPRRAPTPRNPRR